ncbi:expressed unknown protein [Seminavis robusta]|uniref:Uncharacterized protein n=1 Tax=Seminavis robusta TaxID=568900 RepID=A0A9N8H7B7_9STRA|nr:expressed unknown protein [Seminavis robusta]|eukprot:Sro136_g064160.1 n/a (166) ;mRNA; f:69823-70320
MGVPTHIYVVFADNDDESIVSWQSRSSNHRRFQVSVELSSPRPRRGRRASKKSCDVAMTIPHRRASQKYLFSKTPQKEEGMIAPRRVHTATSADAKNSATSCEERRKKRRSIDAELLAFCTSQMDEVSFHGSDCARVYPRRSPHPGEDSCHDNDRPPRMPRRNSN